MAAARLADPAIQLAFLNEGYASQVLNKMGWWRATITPIASSVGLNTFTTLGRADGYLSRPGNVFMAGVTLAALRHVRLSDKNPMLPR